MAITVTKLEVLALKKLVLISNALAQSLKDRRAAAEQRSLTQVLVDVVSRADLDNASPSPPNPTARSEG